MDRQPTRSKRVVADRRFDKTQLRASGHGRTIHRDYASHALRWSYVAEQMLGKKVEEELIILSALQVNDQVQPEPVKPYVHPYLKNMFFKYGWVPKEIKQGMRILDVGCGQDQPLLYVLGARIQTVPKLYVGVDLNRIMRKSNVKWARIHDEFDFVTKFEEIFNKYGHFDAVTNFEVIEHMNVEDGARLLKAMSYCLRPNGTLYLSTPVFDGQAAANHVHEYTIPELQAAIEAAGFKIERRLGTFASKPTIRHAMLKAGRQDHLKVYDELESWFGGDVMSTFLSALYPDASRNNIWVCKKP